MDGNRPFSELALRAPRPARGAADQTKRPLTLVRKNETLEPGTSVSFSLRGDEIGETRQAEGEARISILLDNPLLQQPLLVLANVVWLLLHVRGNCPRPGVSPHKGHEERLVAC